MNETASSSIHSSSQIHPKIYKEAFKLLYNTRRWGPRLLSETCRRFNISPQHMLRTYSVLLAVRLSRSKPIRRPRSREKELFSFETLKLMREALLAASFSGYSDRQHTDALLNGTQTQLKLRNLARYVDSEVEQDSFHHAVCSLPQAQHVSDDVRRLIADKLRAFYESERFRSSEGKKTKLLLVAPLTEHLARYRLYTNYWRYYLLAGRSSNLYAELCNSANEVHLDRHVVDAGIRAITNAFGTDSVTLKFGEQFRVFESLLNGKASSMWNKFVASKESTSSITSTGFRWFGRDCSAERIAEAGGLGGIGALRADPGRLLDASHISSDDFHKVATSLSKEDSQYEQLMQLFDALCARTSTGDCREVVKIVWKEGGLCWLRKASVSDICKKAELTEDEAGRIQSFARGYFGGWTRNSGHIQLGTGKSV